MKSPVIDTIDIKVGFECNNKCLFCIQGNKRETTPNLSDAEVKERLAQGKKENRQRVVFTGGEPTFRPKELIRWVAHAKRIGYEIIQIQTNGRIFSYLDYCKEMIKAGANEFGPALHGSTADLHDRLTQAPGSFKQTTQGIKNLKFLNQRVIINSVVNRLNYRDLPALARLLVDLRVDQFQFAFMHINNLIVEDPEAIKKYVPIVSEVMPYVKKGLDIGIKSGVSCMTEAVPYCLMSGYEDYIAERIIPKAHVFDADIDIESYEKYRKTEGKAKGPDCSRCRYDKICEGPWREYPAIFGWDEFKPIVKSKKIK